MKLLTIILLSVFLISCGHEKYLLPIEIAGNLEPLLILTPENQNNDDPLFDKWLKLPKLKEAGWVLLSISNALPPGEIRIQTSSQQSSIENYTYSIEDSRLNQSLGQLVIATKIEQINNDVFIRWSKNIGADQTQNSLSAIVWQANMEEPSLFELIQNETESELRIFEAGKIQVSDYSFIWQAPGDLKSKKSRANYSLAVSIDTKSRQEKHAIVLSTFNGTRAHKIELDIFAKQSIVIPEQLLAKDFSKLSIEFNNGLKDFKIALSEKKPDNNDALEPILSDLGAALSFSQKVWRSSALESFRWNQFPNIVLIDFASTPVQDRYLKRMVFFIEKKRFRGSILSNDELLGKHGWNANNFRPIDLARFFNTASQTGFELNPEELWLRSSLIAWGILVQAPEDPSLLAPGLGGLISIARGMAPSTRQKLLNHEALHAVFYEIKELEIISRRLLQGLSLEAKDFFYTFFDFMSYDINDDFLMVNEFQAYLLQQAIAELPTYLGIMANRLDAIGYKARRDYLETAQKITQELVLAAQELANYLISHNLDHASLALIKRYTVL